MTAMTITRAQEYTLSNREFAFLCDFTYNNSGIVLDERKREMVYRRLMRRIRELRLDSFSQYCDFLKRKDNEESTHFINAITTNLTSFFREQHHFDYLVNCFLPSHYQQCKHKKLRLWSAGCSTGEEPYSIAISVLQSLKSEPSVWDTKILATDLDSEVLSVASQGIYDLERIAGLDNATKKAWFYKNNCEQNAQVRVSPQLQSLIRFKQLNLLQTWPMQGPFDVIFCRNVMIYFDRQTQDQLVQRFLRILRPGGVLFLGHSESVSNNGAGFDSLGKTIYTKPMLTATGEASEQH